MLHHNLFERIDSRRVAYLGRAINSIKLSAIIVLVVVALSSHVSGRILEGILGRSASHVSFDEIHQAAILDHESNYIEPIKSLHTRQTISLNGLYDFCFDSQSSGFKRRWFEKTLVDSCRPNEFHRMPVPSAFNDILSSVSAKNYMGWFWYQTELTLGAPLDEQYLADNSSLWFIQFESINYLALIWAERVSERSGVQIESDAKLVGSHVGGHLPIVVDVSEFFRSQNNLEVLPGHKLRLTIAVSNQLTRNTIPSGQMVNLTEVVGKPLYRFQPDFDFFHYAGIMGDVRLVRLPPVYIRRVSASVQEQDLILMVCYGGARSYRSLTEHLVSIVGFQDILVTLETSDCSTIKVDCSSKEGRERFELIRGRADWPTVERPVTIRVQIELFGGTKVDTFDVKVMRHANMTKVIEMSGGQLQGFGMHHEQLFSGRSMSLAAIMKDLNLVKQLGANVIRTSHYPYSSAYLEACDELGIMVIAECAAVGLKSFSKSKLILHKQMLKEMMLRDHEHPSIVMWSVANEPSSQLREAREYFASLLQYARTELAEFTTNANRPLTAAIAQSHEADTIANFLDVIMVNRYFGWYDYTGVLETIGPALSESLAGWAKKYQKPLVLSEFGADTMAGLHSGELFSEEFQRRLIEEHERLFDQMAAANKSQMNFLGGLIWNFADFSTHESLLRVGGNKKGVFTVDRRPKMAAECIEKIFRKRGNLLTIRQRDEL